VSRRKRTRPGYWRARGAVGTRSPTSTGVPSRERPDAPPRSHNGSETGISGRRNYREILVRRAGAPGTRRWATEGSVLLEALDWTALRDEYRRATPWPHLVVDGILPADVPARVVAEAVALPERTLVRRRSRRQFKMSSLAADDLGATTRNALEVLSGSQLTEFVQTVTGIDGLEPDATFCRAGLFVYPAGGWQRVHEDFPVHPHTGLWNRAVALLYCSDWTPGMGGRLELWPADMSEVGRRIEPMPGRLVIFEPTRAHPHGVEALSPDAGVRVTLSSRMYSHEAPELTPSPPMLRWSRRPSERRRDVWPTASEFFRELTTQARRRSRKGSSRRDTY
jgi:Rps23 Pro-64 3,4-dihydroxylase Tpa1-like proline 4-hydroxylase